MTSELLAKVGQVLRAQAMRTHPFEPMKRDARYCGHMSVPATSGSAETGHVSLSAECGYPPDLHPPRSPALGQGPDESAVTHVARKRHRCMEYLCQAVIQPGEKYVRAVTFPSHEVAGGRMGSWKFCAACATRHGRPLPAMSDRAQKVDPEAVAIAVRGDRLVKLNRPERRQAMRRLLAAGASLEVTAARVGVTTRTVSRVKRALRAEGAL